MKRECENEKVAIFKRKSLFLINLNGEIRENSGFVVLELVVGSGEVDKSQIFTRKWRSNEMKREWGNGKVAIFNRKRTTMKEIVT